MKKYIDRLIKIFPLQLLGVFFAIFIIFLPFENKLVAYGHDIGFHITNFLSNIYFINLSHLNLLIPKIFGGLIANGFGYGTGIFYPPLSYYLTTYCGVLLEFLNINPIISVTLVEILVVVASGLVMYLFLNELFSDKNVSGIGAISYVTSTYLLCDIYIRTALAELLTFLFIPIIFWGLYDLFFKNGKKFKYLFVIGYVGMIFSHLVITVYVTLLILILFILRIKYVLKKDIIKKLVISSIIILLLTSPFTIPLLEHKFFGDYVVFNENAMYSIDQITVEALEIDDFLNISMGNNGIKIYINQIVLMLFIVVLIFNKKIFKKDKRTIFYIALCLVLLSGYVSSIYFPWKYVSSFIKMIQFPWRMMVFISFGMAIIVGNVVKIIKGENKKLFIVIIALVIIFSSYNHITRYCVGEQVQVYYEDMGVQKEYLPVRTSDNMNYFENRNQQIIVRDGQASIDLIENNVPNIKANILLNSEVAILELPALYYLGYKIELINEQGKSIRLDYRENEYGFVEINVLDSGLLNVTYEGTLANKIARCVAVFTFIGIFGFNIIFKKSNKI